MPIITISRGCHSHGKEIAERVAQALGYECISREVLLEASRFFHVSEKKLLHSIHDAFTLLERITHDRNKYLAYIRAALLEHVKRDNVVYHGYAGHLLIPEIPHVLKVRVIAELEDRVALLGQRENLSREEAFAHIENEDKQRIAWTDYLYEKDVNDPHLYDLVLCIGRLKIEHASEIIVHAARLDAFQATEESKKEINDLALSSHVKAALLEICDAEVTSDNGRVTIRAKTQKMRKTGYVRPKVERQIQERMRYDLLKQIIQVTGQIPDVEGVTCDIDLPYYT